MNHEYAQNEQREQYEQHGEHEGHVYCVGLYTSLGIAILSFRFLFYQAGLDLVLRFFSFAWPHFRYHISSSAPVSSRGLAHAKVIHIFR